jgi:hypothetical protein
MLPNKPIEFPVSTFALVKALKEACSKYESLYPVLADVRIATKRADPQQSGVYEKQIIISDTASFYVVNGLKKRQNYNINFFTKDEETAADLGVALEVAFQSIRDEVFHWIVISMAPMEVPDSKYVNEHHHWMTLDALIAGKAISL